jgi:hypothetical protein
MLGECSDSLRCPLTPFFNHFNQCYISHNFSINIAKLIKPHIMKTYIKSAHCTVLVILLLSVTTFITTYFTIGSHPMIEVPIIFGVFSLMILPACSTKN